MLAAEQTVTVMIRVMKADFGKLFTAQFEDGDIGERERSLMFWRKRFLAGIVGRHQPDVYDAYEQCVKDNPGRPPKLPELFARLDVVERDRRRQESESARARAVAALPPPNGGLDENLRNKARIIRMLREALGDMDRRETPGEKAARHQRLDGKLAAHGALLRRDFPRFGSPHVGDHHLCAAPGCGRAGTLSHATSGNGAFFCGAHFRRG